MRRDRILMAVLGTAFLLNMLAINLLGPTVEKLVPVGYTIFGVGALFYVASVLMLGRKGTSDLVGHFWLSFVIVVQEVKKRVIYVYPSLRQVERWREGAERQGMSLSKFVMEHAENSLRQEEDSSYQSRAKLTGRIRELEEDQSAKCILAFSMGVLNKDKH